MDRVLTRENITLRPKANEIRFEKRLPDSQQNVSQVEMKSKFLYGFFALLLVTGLAATIYFGLKPKPIPKIRLSSFEKPVKFSQAIELRMRQEIAGAPILLFGYQPERPEQLEIIQEFIRTNNEPGYNYDTLVIEERLVADLSAEKINSRDRLSDLASGLKKALESNRRVMVVLPSAYTSQIVVGNVANLLKKDHALPVTSFTIVELIRRREDEKSVAIPCFVTEADPTGAGALGCAVLQQSRNHYRKKMAPGKKTGMMDQRGATDYLIFYSNEEEKNKGDEL